MLIFLLYLQFNQLKYNNYEQIKQNFVGGG